MSDNNGREKYVELEKQFNKEGGKIKRTQNELDKLIPKLQHEKDCKEFSEQVDAIFTQDNSKKKSKSSSGQK